MESRWRTAQRTICARGRYHCGACRDFLRDLGWPARPGTGGTAGQVAWFERGYAPIKYSLYEDALSPLAPLEPGLSIHIDPANAQVSMVEAGQTQDGKRDVRTILKRTDRYNRNVEANRDLIAGSERTEANATGKGLGVADSVYQAANGLSKGLANKVRTSDATVYLLALLAVVTFNLVSNYPSAPWVYFVVTGLMALLTSRVLFLSVDNRFLEYRCLAEAMRTLFFLRSAGITRPVWHAYLSRQAGVVHWIRHAVRSVEFCQNCLLPQRKDSGSASADDIAFVKKAWI